MEILWWKVIILLTLFVACLLASLLPLKFVRLAAGREGRQQLMERVLRLLNCFGGGVFLATCLLDLLPDVEEKFDLVLAAYGIRTGFALAEFVTAVGLFLILCVEQIAYDCKERATRGHRAKTAAKRSGTTRTDRTAADHNEKSPLLQHTTTCKRPHEHSDGSVNIPDSVPAGQQQGHSHGAVATDTGEHALIQHTDSHDMVTSSSLRSLLLLLALSLHSLFEGLAVGLQSDISQLVGIFTAILIHKVVLALSLGINFVQSTLRPTNVVLASVCFASMAPLGIAIAILLNNGYDSNTHNLVSGILQGLATGTFLYITFFEVLPMEMSQPGDRLPKVLCSLLGFILITATLFLDPNVSNPKQP